MSQHPYIGLHATRPARGQYVPREDGIIVAVGQGGTSANEDECAFIAAVLLRDDGTHVEIDLSVATVDPAEAKARLTTAPQS